jgi:hypothetical protein
VTVVYLGVAAIVAFLLAALFGEMSESAEGKGKDALLFVSGIFVISLIGILIACFVSLLVHAWGSAT